MGILDLYDSIETVQENNRKSISIEMLKKINELKMKCGIHDDIEAFMDPDFLNSFFTYLNEEEQIKYLENTNNYSFGIDCDLNYVLVYRRSVFSGNAKPESFWTTEFNQVRYGLKNELPLESPQRLYSSIMVTSIGKLNNHGIIDLDHGGATDGEIVIDADKPFSDFLFVYKPEDEKYKLEKYIENGGMSLDELLKNLSNTSEERKHAQGF